MHKQYRVPHEYFTAWLCYLSELATLPPSHLTWLHVSLWDRLPAPFPLHGPAVGGDGGAVDSPTQGEVQWVAILCVEAWIALGIYST